MANSNAQDWLRKAISRKAVSHFIFVQHLYPRLSERRQHTHPWLHLSIVQRSVLRQNSMRTENSAIPCRDGCPIQVIPSPSRRNARAVYLYI